MKTIQQHEDTLRANMGIIQRTRARLNAERAELDTFTTEFNKATKTHRAAVRDELKRY